MENSAPFVPAVPVGLLDDANEGGDTTSSRSKMSEQSCPATPPNATFCPVIASSTVNPSPSSEMMQSPNASLPNNNCSSQDRFCAGFFDDTFSDSVGRVTTGNTVLRGRVSNPISEEGEICHKEDMTEEEGLKSGMDLRDLELNKEATFAGSSFSARFVENDDKDTTANSDDFKVEVDAMLTALKDTSVNRRGGIPPIGIRIPIERLAERENPLEKEGRNTVIRGRFRDDHPFATAARCLGYKLVSPRYSNLSLLGEHSESRDEHERMRLFLLDCNAVYKFLKGKDIKVPIIGGGPLNMFELQREVLFLGGLQNVVEKRAFRIVAQQLELPSTCTSAAYVLKGTYERFLYHYEQLLVFGKWPRDANETVNMKSLVSASRERERERRTSRLPSFRERRRDSDENGDTHMDDGTSVEDTTCRRGRRIGGSHSDSIREYDPPTGVSTASAYALKDFMAASSTNPAATWNYYCHLTGDEGGEFSLPRWGLELPTEDAQVALIRTALNVEKRCQGKFQNRPRIGLDSSLLLDCSNRFVSKSIQSHSGHCVINTGI